MSELLPILGKVWNDPVGCLMILFWAAVGVLFIAAAWWDITERQHRTRRAELAAERERLREQQEQSRYKTAKVLERGQKRQHRHERESQSPARPTLPPRRTRPALPAPEDDG